MTSPVPSILAQAEVSSACGTEPNLVCKRVYEATGSEFWARAAEWAVDKPLRALIILAVAWVVVRLLRRAIDHFVQRAIQRSERARHDLEAEEAAGADVDRAERVSAHALAQQERSRQRTETMGGVLKSLTAAVIYLLAGLIALSEFEIDLGPLIAGAGIAGIALGFGAQSIVRDFLAGFFMLIEDQYGVGDIINFGEATGVVEAVTLRMTRLRDVEGTVWFVPNGEILRVANKSQLWARAVLDVEVAYDTDLSAAADVIKGVADEVWREQVDKATIIEEPEIWGVEDFGPNSVVIRLVIKTEPGEQFVAAREIRGRLKAAFDAAGIEIPFPQRTVWLHRAEAAASPGSSGVLHARRPDRPLPEST